MTSKDKIKTLMNVACKYLEIDLETLTIRTRKRRVVEARYIIMYFLTNNPNEFKLGLRETGELFISKHNPIGFDHATVLHAKKNINNLIDTKSKLYFGGDVRKAIDEMWAEYRGINMSYSKKGLKPFVNTLITMRYRNNGEYATVTGMITSLGTKAFLMVKEELMIPLAYEQIIKIEKTNERII